MRRSSGAIHFLSLFLLLLLLFLFGRRGLEVDSALVHEDVPVLWHGSGASDKLSIIYLIVRIFMVSVLKLKFILILTKITSFQLASMALILAPEGVRNGSRFGSTYSAAIELSALIVTAPKIRFQKVHTQLPPPSVSRGSRVLLWWVNYGGRMSAHTTV